MTDGGGWLAARRPSPPADLANRFEHADDLGGHDLVEHLASEALRALDRARANPGRVRESALDLLVADALLTYACEAALELPDGAGVLDNLMVRAAEAR